MLLLAFDVGRKKTGVAIGNTLTGGARPLATVRGGQERQFAAIGAHICSWAPQRLIVGLPLHMDGSEHGMTRHCRTFAQRLAQQFGLPVALADERLTTIAAASRGGDDAVAAAIILQGWLDDNADNGHSSLPSMSHRQFIHSTS